MFLNFQVAYYGKESTQTIVSRSDFKSKAPLTVIDCSQQNETMKYAPVDVRIEFESTGNFPAGTSAYCLILHDRIVQYKPISGEVKKM